MTADRDASVGRRDGEQALRVLAVAELNRVARLAIEDRFDDLWVEGELADVRRPASGHVYFTLCDPERPAQVRGVMYRSDALRSRARLEDGARVRARGHLTLYEPRGDFQIVARIALPAGEGDRAAELARLKKKLEQEGLLDPARKRKLPRFPRVVVVVTSRDGAALHDIVRVALRRMPVHIVLVHCQVQGPEAPASIVKALRGAHRVPGADVVIVARGGGAAEDLSAFDDEQVVRAVAACRIPTVSGVGHELDVTLVDLVADVRAATPSHAAEIVVPDAAQVRAELEALERGLARALEQVVQRARLRLERALRRLADPRRRLSQPRHVLTRLHASLERSIRRRLGDERRALERLRARLAAHEPRSRLGRDRERLAQIEHALVAAVRARLASQRRAIDGFGHALALAGSAIVRVPRSELARLVGKLDALSPLGILARGYAVVLHQGRALLQAEDVAPGDLLRIRLHRGALDVRVERTDHARHET